MLRFPSSFRRRAPHALFVSILVVPGWGCAKDSPTDVVTPAAGPPARMETLVSTTQAGAIHGIIPLFVRITDSAGRAVRGTYFHWTVTTGGGGARFSASPTNEGGVAETEWILGTIAGYQSIVAAVPGVAGLNKVFSATVAPGPLSKVSVSRDSIRLAVLGATSSLAAVPRDQYGNAISAAILWTTEDSTIASVNNGLVTARANGKTTVRASVGSITAPVGVTVSAATPGSPCEGISGVLDLSVGGVASFAGRNAAGMCIAPPAAGGDYAAIALSVPAGFLRIPVSISVSGASSSPLSLTSAAARASGRSLRVADEGITDFGRDLRRQAYPALLPLVDDARVVANRSAGARSLTAVPSVGDLMELNGDAVNGCTRPSMRTGKVIAVSDRAIVVADVANPANGFSDDQYRTLAATFDTLIHPQNTATFGVPSDIDNNGRVIMFFTRAVNELTPASAGYSIGGFFHPRDLFPRAGSARLAACPASNAAEMFYLIVPDPDGAINGNRRTVADMFRANLSTIAHEYQHMVNSSRRLYVTNAHWPEEVWLDEGLSHIAEEVTFYASSGLTSRRNIDLPQIQSSPRTLTAANNYMTPNLARMGFYLAATELYSPIPPDPFDDALETRGATWSFLRYAVDRMSGSDADIWMRLANGPAVGISNLLSVFGPVDVLLRDWAVANILDDLTPDTGDNFSHRSWNFRSLLPALFSGKYPLATRSAASEGVLLELLDGGVGYFRFASDGKPIGVRAISADAVPRESFLLSIVRTR